MDQEFREVRRVMRRAIRLGQDAREKAIQIFSLVPQYGYYLLSFTLTALVFINAYARCGYQFYPSILYLMNSKVSLLIIDVQLVVLFHLFFKLIVHIFFSPLSEDEQQELHETTWYDTLDCMMFLTLFKGEITHMIALEVLVLIMSKSLIYLANKRVDQFSISPDIPRLSHIKNIAVLSLSVIASSRLTQLAYHRIVNDNSSHQLVLGIEHILLMLTIFHIVYKYGMYKYCHCRPSFYRRDEFLKVAEVINYFIRLVFYLGMVTILSTYDSLPLFLLRNVYQSLKEFTESFDTWRRARHAVQTIESNIFDISEEELNVLEDRTCAICRDEMTINTRQKRLGCGHCFHIQCMRDWFQRQPRCPTCRADVVRPVQSLQEGSTGQNAQNQSRQRRPGVPEAVRRIPPDVLNMLNRLARIASEAEQAAELAEQLNEELPQDFNVQISITQNSYTTPPQYTATPPPPIPRFVLESLNLQQLQELSEHMVESMQIRLDVLSNILQNLVVGQRYLIHEVEDVDSVLRHLTNFVEDNEEARDTQNRIEEITQSIRRIAESARELTLRNFSSSTRDVSTQVSHNTATLLPPRVPRSNTPSPILARSESRNMRDIVDMGVDPSSVSVTRNMNESGDLNRRARTLSYISPTVHPNGVNGSPSSTRLRTPVSSRLSSRLDSRDNSFITPQLNQEGNYLSELPPSGRQQVRHRSRTNEGLE